MASYESIMQGLEDVGEGIDHLKAVNALLLEALKWMMATRRNADSEAGLEAEAKSNAAIKAATEA